MSYSPGQSAGFASTCKLSDPEGAMRCSTLVQGLSEHEVIQDLAERLAAIHGPVYIRREASGVHLCMACPKCLEDYGRRELRSRHLQLNADKYLGLGKWAHKFLPQSRTQKRGYAQCMKEHGKFTLAEMLEYPPLEDRGIENHTPRLIVDGSATRYLVPDDNGNMIPDHPGKTTPLSMLPYGHPALEYLEARGYDPILLYAQFNAAWCTEEAPEGEQYNRWYRRHAGQWKSTPQGRIIFYSMLAGVQSCWQGRYLEMEHESGRYVWHPYQQAWTLRPEWSKGEEPVKYLTAPGSMRNTQLCGYDAVAAASDSRREAIPTCVLTEGPLDAARFPDRGMAVLGKNLSDMQAFLLRIRFPRVILAFDADGPGLEATKRAEETLALNNIQTRRFFTPAEEQSDSKIDVGSLGYAVCAERLRDILLSFR